MSGSIIGDAFARAGYDTSRDEMFSLVSQMRAKGKSLREIEQETFKRCVRRPTLFGPIIAAYVERVDADMSFRREPDGGQGFDAREGHEHSAADFSRSDASATGHARDALDVGPRINASGDNSAGDGSGGHPALAREGHVSDAAVNSSSEAGQPTYADKGQGGFASSLDDPESREATGHARLADKAKGAMPASRDTTISEAARILGLEGHRQQMKKARAPGAGALGRAGLDAEMTALGASFLSTHVLSNGRKLVELRFGEMLPTAEQLERNGGPMLFDAILLRKYHAEAKRKLGQIQPDQIVGKTPLPDSSVRAIESAMSDGLHRARRAVRGFVNSELLQMSGEANG